MTNRDLDRSPATLPSTPPSSTPPSSTPPATTSSPSTAPPRSTPPSANVARRPFSWRDLGPNEIANGFVGWLFAASAPVAIILSAGRQGGLSEAQLASWIFGVFVVNGLISIAFSAHWRLPLAFAWTIPGTVLVGPALAHLSFAEVVGAYLVTGALIAGRDRLGEEGDGGHADADRDGHGRRRVPAFRARPRPCAARRPRHCLADGGGVRAGRRRDGGGR